MFESITRQSRSARRGFHELTLTVVVAVALLFCLGAIYTLASNPSATRAQPTATPSVATWVPPHIDLQRIAEGR